MTREFKKSLMGLSVLALGYSIAAVAPARAADLSGDCCADLEERIAELEATTARKGNRKVSLTVSGHINEAVLFWDDGEESNAYVVTNENSRSRFRFTGEAKIDKDWTAGYLLEVGVRSTRGDRVNQNDDDADAVSGLDIRHSSWFLKNKSLGAVYVGQTPMASESITETSLANLAPLADSDVQDTMGGFFLRNSATGALSTLEWRRLINDGNSQPGEGNRRSAVRYETPTWEGLKASAAWGEDDAWDVGLRYTGEFAGFKVAAGIAYGQNHDEAAAGGTAGFNCVRTTPNADCEQVGGSIAVMHVATGLFINFNAGWFQDENITVAVPGADDTNTFWMIQAGLEQKFFDLGKTTLFGEYYDYDGGATNRTAGAALGGGNVLSSGVEMIGFGIVQSLDAAAMDLYMNYRHYEGDLATTVTASVPLEDFDALMTGAIIKF